MLTRVQLHFPARATVGPGAAAFGIVGGLLGAAAAAVLVAASPAGATVAALLAVATLALMTGALHLDGLADTADALAARDASRAEQARRDPRAGTAAVVAIVVAVTLDTALTAQLVERDIGLAAAAVVVAAAVSRAAAAVTPLIARGRVRPGSAEWFVRRTGAAAAWIAVSTAIVVAAIVSLVVRVPEVVLAGVGGLVLAAAAAEWLIRRRGRLDGDGIGAIVEIAFAAVLFVMVALLSVS